MKAKMENKVPENAVYSCIRCDTSAFIGTGLLHCFTCGNEDSDDLVPIYMEDNPDEESFYLPIEFPGG